MILSDPEKCHAQYWDPLVNDPSVVGEQLYAMYVAAVGVDRLHSLGVTLHIAWVR